MDAASYSLMQTDVCYTSYHVLGGKCVIKKSADLVKHGLVHAKLDDGRIVERHFSFFSWIDQQVSPDPFTS